jgi:hypothetical protein
LGELKQMNPWTVQLLTLLGVVIGALASFFSTRYLERSRWQRDETVRWGTRRLDCYSEFASALKRFIGISHRLAAGLGLPATAQNLDLETGLPALASAKEELYVRWEQILMLGNPSTIIAARQWRKAAEKLEQFARGLQEEPSEWMKAEKDSVEAREHFYKAVRDELAIFNG